MRIQKQFIALVLALAGLLGCLTGCGGDTTEPALEESRTSTGTADPVSESDQPRGRYVEQSLSIPADDYALDMVKLSDGRLRYAARDNSGTVHIYTASSNSDAWETEQLPTEILEGGNLASLALSEAGEVFCATVKEGQSEGSFEYLFWLVDSGGTCAQIPVDYPDADPQAGFLMTCCDFTAQGRVYGVFQLKDVREIDLETGEVGDNINDSGSMVGYLGCVGEDVYMLGHSGNSVFRDGQTETLSGVFGEQIDEAIQEFFGNSNLKTALWGEDPDYLFFTTHEGIFSYVPGGSVTEELVSGKRSSLGDPSFYTRSLIGGEDGVFYVLGNYEGGGIALLRYAYDENAVTVSEGHLRIYTLYPDEDLQQMISQFQIANPGITVDLEVGIQEKSGVAEEGAMTEADAIRTLNTQILAGDGPDLLVLDGLSMDAYLEKELLIDLTDVLSQGEPLLQQVTHCYAQDGMVFMVPTSFAIPAVYAPADVIPQITDLESLVSVAAQLKVRYPNTNGVLRGAVPRDFADLLYDSCSAAWVKEDGTLDEGKLTEFYDLIFQLFELDQDFRTNFPDYVSIRRTDESFFRRSGWYTGLSGAHFIATEDQSMSVGTLQGMLQWSMVLGGSELVDGYETGYLNGQAQNSFVPKRIMGILSTSTQQEAAEKFLTFMLSDQVQSKDLSTGFPVNQTTFDREIAEDRTVTTRSTAEHRDGTKLSLDDHYPDAGMRQNLKIWVDQLTTPALTDQIIRNLVMDQMNDCLDGIITPQQAAQAALQNLNLYLSE